MNGYDTIANILVKEGVKWMACFPDNALINAVARAGIRPIVFRQERGGIMAADGFSRLMAEHGQYGVFACQHGPGAENAFGGIAQTWADNVPILFLVDGYPPARADVVPNFNSVKSYANIAKQVIAINSPDRVVSQMRRVMTALKNGRPGPVILEMPRGIMDQEVDSPEEYQVTSRYPYEPSRQSVKDAVAQLLKAKNPVIWAGQGVLRGGASKELVEFAELAQIPVITTMPGKSAIDERHALSLGSTNRSAPKAVWKWIKESDLVLALGSSFTKTNYGIDIPLGKFMIHNTVTVEDIGKEYPTDIGLPGDVKLTLNALIDETKGSVGASGRGTNSALQGEIAKVKQEWRKDFESYANDTQTPMNPYRLINEIEKAVDHETTIFTHDAGHPRDQVMPFYTATVPNSYIGWGKTTHLGYGICLMIGAKIANPDKFCVNFMGDAAFGMSGLDIETAVRSGYPTTTILLNNGTMGGYDKRMPKAMNDFGAGHMTGDYAMIAEGLGATGIRVSDPNEVGPALKKARQINDNEGKSVLLDVKTRTESKFSVY